MATNKVNGKLYIGQTWQTLAQRKSKHVFDSLSSKGTTYFNLAIKKHGPENFVWKEIDRVFTEKAADALEIHYIKYYKTRNRNIGYNLAKGGKVNRGWKCTPEQNNNKSKLYKQLYAEGKMVCFNKGKTFSPERRVGMININPASKEVRCVETGNIYPSIREAARQTNIDRCSIRKVIVGKQATAGELHWESYPRTKVDDKRDSKKFKTHKRKVLCNETGITYRTIKEAGIATGVDETAIGKIIDGKRNTPSKGLTFTEIL